MRMVGFWIFITVFVICATFVACSFLDNAKENFSLWETKRGIDSICRRLDDIEKALAKMGGE